MTARPCLNCGEPTDGSRCEECYASRPRSEHALTSSERGYDSRWRRLSVRARRLQPWCSDCGATDDLTADHRRWPARSLADVEVVCRSCNGRRGAIRSGVTAAPRGGSPEVEHGDRRRQPLRPSLTAGEGS
jgi:hypothetical protein